MADLYSPEDEAALYVLGELSGAERREFEGRLALSAELCALVRELEEGTVALSMASPQRRPPGEVWLRIEQEVAGTKRRKIVIPAFWIGWWRNGWGAAAACLAGWYLETQNCPVLWYLGPFAVAGADCPIASATPNTITNSSLRAFMFTPYK